MKEKCNCIGRCAKPILNEQVMKCQDDVMKKPKNILSQPWEIQEYVNQLEYNLEESQSSVSTQDIIIKRLAITIKRLKEEKSRLIADYMKISRAETDLFEALDIIIGFFEIGIIEIKAIKDEVDVNAIIKAANKAISLSCETHEYIRKMKGKRRKQEKGEE